MQGYLFLAPFLVLSLVFMAYPIVLQFYQSLFKVKFQRTTFVALQNYFTIFTESAYVKSIGNTILFTAVVVPLLIIAGIWIAGCIFDRSPRFISAVRISLYLPVIVSLVVMVTIWRFLLDSQSGLIRYFCTIIGVPPVDLLANTISSRIIVMLILFVVNIGQCVLLYIADMIGIPGELIDASKIDGVSRIGMFRHILIPLSRPTTLFVFITETSACLKVFIIIQLMTSGGPNYATTTMMYQLYNDAFYYSNQGLASAMGVLLFGMALALISLRFIFDKRRSKEALR